MRSIYSDVPRHRIIGRKVVAFDRGASQRFDLAVDPVVRFSWQVNGRVESARSHRLFERSQLRIFCSIVPFVRQEERARIADWPPPRLDSAPKRPIPDLFELAFGFRLEQEVEALTGICCDEGRVDGRYVLRVRGDDSQVRMLVDRKVRERQCRSPDCPDSVSLVGFDLQYMLMTCRRAVACGGVALSDSIPVDSESLRLPDPGECLIQQLRPQSLIRIVVNVAQKDNQVFVIFERRTSRIFDDKASIRSERLKIDVRMIKTVASSAKRAPCKKAKHTMCRHSLSVA